MHILNSMSERHFLSVSDISKNLTLTQKHTKTCSESLCGVHSSEWENISLTNAMEEELFNAPYKDRLHDRPCYWQRSPARTPYAGRYECCPAQLFPRHTSR